MVGWEVLLITCKRVQDKGNKQQDTIEQLQKLNLNTSMTMCVEVSLLVFTEPNAKYAHQVFGGFTKQRYIQM